MYKLHKGSVVMELLGIRRSRIQYYVDQGIICPARDSGGSGTYRLFSQRNIDEIRVAMALVKTGMRINKVRETMSTLRGRDLCGKLIIGFNSTSNHIVEFETKALEKVDRAIVINIDRLLIR